MVLTAMASRNSGRPAAGVYLWFFTSRHARAAASTMLAGVGKSGSPAPKPITFSRVAFSALALASTASVADSAMAARRADVRFTGGTPDRRCGSAVAATSLLGAPPAGRATFSPGAELPTSDVRPDWSGDSGADQDGDPTLDAAERRALRLRSVQDQGRTGIGVGEGQQQPARQLASTGSGEERRRRDPRRPGRTVLAAGWVADRVGQRRVDGLLGCRHLRADRRVQPALRVR